MTAINPDAPCPHDDFDAQVNVQRLVAEEGGAVTAYIAEITIACTQCAEPFRWTGVPAGLSGNQPTCSVDEATLNAPMRPASADPDFGMGIPGYAINFRMGSQ